MHATSFIATVLTVLAPTGPDPARVAQIDQGMGAIAAQSQMGFVDEKVPLEQLEQRIAAGQRVYIPCSIAAELGFRWAQRNNVPARRVSVLSNEPFDGYNDGHAMVEVQVDGRWILYDPVFNRAAVNLAGRSVGLDHQVRAGDSRRWKLIAGDPQHLDLRGLDPERLRALRRWARRPAETWYERLMGTALVETGDGQYAYTGRPSRKVESAWPGRYRHVDEATWRTLNP